MASEFVVDAHALIWFLEGNARLGQAAKLAMEDPSSALHLPIIALAEACWLWRRNDVRFRPFKICCVR